MFHNCTSLKLSSTKTDEYTQEYRIPSSGNGTTATDALTNMFTSTGGTFTGTPEINTIYYLSSDNMIVRGNDIANLNGYVKTMIDAAVDIPTTLPNPNALTFTGAVTGSYDGSAPISVNIPMVPTKTSQLTNDSGFLTSHQDISGKQDKATLEADVAAKGFTKNTGTYSKPAGGIPKSDFDAAVQTSLGKADTALQEHQSLAAYRTAAAQDEIDSGKVDKVTGKGLSTNDYTASAKAKVDAIPANPKYTDTVYDDTAINERVATIEGKESAWDAKSDFSGSYNDLTDKPTIPTEVTPLIGTTNELTPTQVYNAVSAGIPVKVQYTDGTYGLLSFTAFNIAESLNTIVSQTIVYNGSVYILAELVGYKSNNRWGFMTTTLAQKTDIPSSLKNPNALTIKIGSTTVTYDGSTAQTVTISDGTEVSY